MAGHIKAPCVCTEGGASRGEADHCIPAVHLAADPAGTLDEADRVHLLRSGWTVRLVRVRVRVRIGVRVG